MEDRVQSKNNKVNDGKDIICYHVIVEENNVGENAIINLCL